MGDTSDNTERPQATLPTSETAGPSIETVLAGWRARQRLHRIRLCAGAISGRTSALDEDMASHGTAATAVQVARGVVDVQCPSCGAVMWMLEKTAASPLRSPRFSLCCMNGKVTLPALPATPATLATLITGSNLRSNQFREKIRRYNSALAFTSLGGNVDQSVTHSRGPFSFRIHGQLYHQVGSLLPKVGQRPQFSQLYIHDTEHERENRHAVMPEPC
ncbi:hypothetical protein PsorP6_000056 [Peronosclerospora sorghi]|uniref:Uncharacterized protein n=1 Tax=Peronosclerospora sorghi TaxID=230839 RepID=A0ACC0WSU7_9STRA|nr:hypothetical protein PsorP6_000056 [Peronosclerospora sorghi]